MGRFDEKRRCELGTLGCLALHQLEAIAEGIKNVDAAEAVERGVRLRSEARALAGGQDFVEVVDDEGWMSSLGRVKLGLDAEMQIHGAGGEPNAVAAGHRRGFFNL